MGILRALFPKRIKDPVRGTARVVGCSGTSDRATSQTCQMQLVVDVEGWEPYAIEHTQILKVSRWPSPGMILPVTVSASDPNNLRVETAELPDWQDSAMNQAEQIAASMRGQGGADAAPGAPGQTMNIPGGAVQVHTVGANDDPEAAAQAIAMAEQATGMDLNADGKVGAGSVATPPPAAGEPAASADQVDVDPTQRIEQLERLAALRKSGALTEAEFETEKAKLLGT